MKTTILFFSITIILLTGCKTYSEDDKAKFDAEIQQFLKRKKIKCARSASGLYYCIKEQGEGHNIRFQDKVSFTYKGSFLDGSVFDLEKKPVTFNVSALIPAWKEIMLELKKGSAVFMVVPPQLGYGDRKLDDIPEHSILVFDMKIWNVE